MGLFTKRKKPKEQKSDRDPKKEESERKWADLEEQFKYVCQGGKVQCLFCSVPVADIIVTSNTISLQDKPYATVADNNGKVNLDFKGICTAAPGISKPPCKSVISLGKWKDYSDTFINNDKALLVRSTIPCLFGNIDLKIVHSGQISVLSEIEPRVVKNPRVTKLYWVDAETEEKVDVIEIGKKANLFFVTKDYDAGENVSATVSFKNKASFNNGEKELTFTGVVNSEGTAISEQVYESTIKEDKQEKKSQSNWSSLID